MSRKSDKNGVQFATNGNVVTAYIGGVDKDAINYIHNVLGIKKISKRFYNALLMNKTYFATAKCNVEAGDVFDENYGKALAKTRLKGKLKAAVLKRVNKYIRLRDVEKAEMIAKIEHDFLS